MTDAGARIAHVGIALPNIRNALGFYRDVLGAEPGAPETADGATIVELPLGEASVELLEPRAPTSPVAKFLDRRGPGIHHLCFRVSDLDRTLAACSAAGFRLVGAVPRQGVRGRRIAFLDPRSTAGVLLELTE
jgi:methylmalonyl-CoA/ethylmalonyl-CoA epimerase